MCVREGVVGQIVQSIINCRNTFCHTRRERNILQIYNNNNEISANDTRLLAFALVEKKCIVYKRVFCKYKLRVYNVIKYPTMNIWIFFKDHDSIHSNDTIACNKVTNSVVTIYNLNDSNNTVIVSIITSE